MPTSAVEQLSNCVLVIDELRRVLQCPPEVGLVNHARSIMEKLPNESVARQLLVKMLEADQLLYEQILTSRMMLPFNQLCLIAMGKSTEQFHRLLETVERVTPVVELAEASLRVASSGSADLPTFSP